MYIPNNNKPKHTRATIEVTDTKGVAHMLRRQNNMSKLATIYNVMKEMKNNKGMEGTMDVQITTSEAGQDVEETLILQTSRPFSMENHPGKPGHEGHAEFQQIHGHMKGFMHGAPGFHGHSGFGGHKIDHAMMMIKMLDRTKLEELENKKILSLDLTNADVPEQVKKMLEQSKQHHKMISKMMKVLQESEDPELKGFGFGNCMNEMHPSDDSDQAEESEDMDDDCKEAFNTHKAAMENLKKAGIELFDLTPDSAKIEITVNPENKIIQIQTRLSLVNSAGKTVNMTMKLAS